MTSCVICTVIYRMSIVSPTSVPFLFLVGYFLILQFQVFLYCFYGELVKYESSFIVDSAYKSDWRLLSPSFRRQLLIAMARWSIPITPTVSGVVRLSLSTFVMVIRGAFNLFTVLKTTNNVQASNN
ncbi:putative odorant receptor 19b [Pectinophora gossypiella]|uniref:putative odorant receptor 19b n=1 Tax=Pectinophora gossypiella TaxID=13191 RepID=UPI00214E6912|nr:putative odorant receptor 19b [Pectinophora gossypiella]